MTLKVPIGRAVHFMDNELEIIKISNSYYATVQIAFEGDNCVFVMKPEDDENSAGWKISFPEGFEVTCPHG